MKRATAAAVRGNSNICVPGSSLAGRLTSALRRQLPLHDECDFNIVYAWAQVSLQPGASVKKATA